MLADFFTKPLQGHLFRKFKAVLLGHAHVDWLVYCGSNEIVLLGGDFLDESFLGRASEKSNLSNVVSFRNNSGHVAACVVVMRVSNRIIVRDL